MSLALIIMIVTDFEAYIIPDETQIALALIGVFYAYYLEYTLVQVLLMPVFCILIAMALKYGFILFMKKDGLGMGDVKFFGVAGLYLTPESISGFFLISGLCGIVTSMVWKMMKRGELFPFGPALALALYVIVVFPDTANIANFLLD
jgi:Flp pilus assembly protein protease CpaA